MSEKRALLVDANGNPILTAPLQIDDADKLAVSMYGKSSVAGDKPVLANPSGYLGIFPGTGTAGGDGKTDYGYLLWRDVLDQNRNLSATQYLFNGTTWDRERNNEEITLLASAARTASLFSPDQENYNARGVMISVDVTAIVDTPAITLYVRAIDPTIGGDSNIVIFGAITTVSRNRFLVYPGAVETIAESTLQVQGIALPRKWRIYMSHNDADSITYSVGASYIL